MSNNNIIYKMDDIFEIVQNQINNILYNSFEYYKKFNFILENENIYVNPEDRKKPNNIYIVLKVLPATMTYGVANVPITLTAVSEQNHIDACQRLLTEFSQSFNLIKGRTESGFFYNQNYKAPSSMSSFNEMFAGYRNVFILSGSILLAYNSIQTKIVYYNHYNLYGEEGNGGLNTTDFEELEIVSRNESTLVSMDTQPYSNNNNFSESSPKFASGNFGFWIYLVNNDFCKKVLKLKHKKKSIQENYFAFGVKYFIDDDSDFNETFVEIYRLQSCVINENAGELPTLNVTFTY